jgi:hypothetical protein
MAPEQYSRGFARLLGQLRARPSSQLITPRRAHLPTRLTASTTDFLFCDPIPNPDKTKLVVEGGGTCEQRAATTTQLTRNPFGALFKRLGATR